MIAQRIEIRIDENIKDLLSLGNSFDDIINHLNRNVKIHKKRDSFIPVSKRYLINNWSLISIDKRLTTMYVIHSMKRIKDIKWILLHGGKFENVKDDLGLFELIKFRDKLKSNLVNP
jgi:hypothetical protein